MKVSTLTIEMAANVARLRQDMDRAQKTVDSAMGKIGAAVNTAKSAFGLLGAGLSVAGFGAWVRGAITAADATAKLAQRTGLAVSEVSGLQLALRQSGVSAEQFTPLMAKLGVAITNGNAAFTAMGVATRNTDGSLKTTRQVLVEVSEKFKGYEDGASKTALAVKLLGEEGAKALPFLNQGAEGLAYYDDMARKLGLTLDKDTAQAAERFNDTIDLIGQGTQGAARTIAAKLLPTLNSMASEFFSAAGNGQILDGVARGLSVALKGIYSVALGVASAFRAVGTGIGAAAAAIGALLSRDFSGALAIARDAGRDMVRQLADAGESITRVWAEEANPAVAAMARIARSAAPEVAKLAGATKGASSAGREAAAALREQEKAAKDLADTMAKAMQLTAAAADEYIRAADALVSSNQSLRDEIELIGLSDEARHALLMTKEAQIVADKELLLISLQNAGADEVTLANLEREIELRKQRADLLGKKNAAETALEYSKETERAADQQQKAYADMWASVDRTAHEVFVNVADEGMDAFKRIGKTLKAAILDMLYQMTLKRWIFQISGQISGSFGSGGNGVSWGDLTSMYSAFTTGGSATGGSAAALGAWAGGSMSTANAVGSVYANATGTGISGLLATNGAYGTAGGASGAAGSGAASAMGWMGWAALIAAAVMIAENLYAKGYTRMALGKGSSKSDGANYVGNTNYQYSEKPGNSAIYNYSAENFNRKLFDALGISEKWADLLSGSTRMAATFGRKLGAYGMTANINGGETDVSGFARYKGGVFRSNKTVGVDIDPRDAEILRQQVEATKEAAAAYARAMGLSDEAIRGYTGSVQVNFKNAKTAEEQNKRLAESMERLEYDMLKAAGATDLTKESFKELKAQAVAAANAAGISAQGISDVLLNGMTQGLGSEQTAAQLSDAIVGGIYRSIAQQYTMQIAQMFMSQIITPIFTAMAAGVPISQAISQASIDSMVKSAENAATALNVIFNDPAFREAIGRIGTAISGISGAFGKTKIPNFTRALEERNEAEQERIGLEQRLLELLGRTDILRSRELAKLDKSNRALQVRIWALEDAKAAVEAAYQALERALNAQLEIAQEAEQSLNDLFAVLRDSIRDIRGEVESTNLMQAQQARELIRRAMAGDLPEADRLREAIESVVDNIEGRTFTSAVDRNRERLVLANELEKIQKIVEPRLSAAERQVVLLEQQLDTAKQQIDAINGVDTSVKSVEEALRAFATTMADYSRLMSQAAGVGSGAASGGGGGGYSGGGGTTKSPASSSSWTAKGYGEKNPDLVAHYEATHKNRGWPSELNTLDAYLKWHWGEYGQKEGRAFAMGGAFSGGIVRRPTHFNVGLMGEAGPEAILPLSNIGGALGVRAQNVSSPETNELLRRIVDRLERVEAATTTAALSTGQLDKRVKSVIRTEDGSAVLMMGRPEQKPLLTEAA